MDDTIRDAVSGNETIALTPSGGPNGSMELAPAAYPPQMHVQPEGLAPPPVLEDEPIDWARQIKAIIRHKWVIVLVALLGTGAAFGAWKLYPEVYVARGAIWVQQDDPEELRRGPIASGGLLNTAGWVQLLRSYAVLDSVVLGERLHIVPDQLSDSVLMNSLHLTRGDYVPGQYRLEVSPDGSSVSLSTAQLGVLETVPVGDSLGTSLGFMWAPPRSELLAGRRVDFQVLRARDAADHLNRGLETTMDQQASFIEVSLAGKDPVGQASVLNALMERFVLVATELKNGKLNERVRILGEQLAATGAELTQNEADLERYRVTTITLPSEGGTRTTSAVTPGLQSTRDPAFTHYFGLRERQNAIRYDRERLERALSEAQSGTLIIEAFETIDAVTRSSPLTAALRELSTKRTELRSLTGRYTEEHPPVQRLLEDIATLETTTIPRMATILVDQLLAEEANLEQQIVSAGDELAEIPPRSIEETRRQRAVNIADRLYSELRQRYQEAALAAASSIPDVRILDRSVPPDVPEGDQRLLLAALLFAGSIGLGIVAAIVMDQLDPKLRDAREVTHDLGLTVLGAVPRIPVQSKKRSKELGQVREAFRGLRLNMSYAFGRSGPVLFTITSPAANEGKTTISVNLGVAYAELGKRTLVIDADTRRGDLHDAFQLARTPGLTDFLMEEAPLNETIHSVRDNLDIMPSGSRHPSSPELIGSKRTIALIGELKTRYDVIILDAPPIGAGSDAFILASVAGNVALVLRSGATDLSYAEAKLGPIHRLPIRVLGAILNDVTPNFGYGASKYYADYLPGYEAELELPAKT